MVDVIAECRHVRQCRHTSGESFNIIRSIGIIAQQAAHLVKLLSVHVRLSSKHLLSNRDTSEIAQNLNSESREAWLGSSLECAECLRSQDLRRW